MTIASRVKATGRAGRLLARASSAARRARASAAAVVSDFVRQAEQRLGDDRDNRWARLNDTMATLGRVTDGGRTKLTPYYDTGEAYRDMWAAVDAAKKRVVWHTYICKDDNVGKITLSKLVAAKKRGVDVELLYDSGGNITGRRRLTAELKSVGAKVITYRPFLPHMLQYFARGMDWRRSPALRNHRKILIVDSEVAFVGGLNIGDDYAETTVGGNGRFRDTMCAIRGPSVAHMIEVCRDTVNNQEGAKLHPSLSQRWRQWARRVAPTRQKTSLALQRELARAKLKLRRELVARRASNNPSAEGLQHKHHDHRRHHQQRTDSTVSGDAGEADNAPERPPAMVRRARVAARIRQLAKDLVRRDRSGVAKARREAATVMTARARHFAQALRRRIRGGSHVHRGHGQDQLEKDDDELAHALRHRSVFKCTDIDPALLRNPTPHQSKDLDLSVVANADCAPMANASSGRPPGYEPLQDVVPMSRSTQADVAQVLMCNPHTRDWSLQRALWIATREAHRRVWVTTPYFLPHGKLFRAVLSAARSGVDVRILAGSSTTTDPWFMWYASQYVRHKLLQAGVRVYEFDGGKIMHAKTVVVDRRWACIGSYNWDILSNKLLEASVAAYDRQFARTMEEHFLQDLAMSKQITEDDFANRPWYTRAACAFFYYGVWLSERFTFAGYRDRDLHSPMGYKIDDAVNLASSSRATKEEEEEEEEGPDTASPSPSTTVEGNGARFSSSSHSS